jgi:hypothetical protein
MLNILDLDTQDVWSLWSSIGFDANHAHGYREPNTQC